MSDMYFDIPFRANNTPYNRGDLVTAPPGGHVSLAQMRISPADGYAGVYLPASLDLTPYLGDRVVCLDTALKKHIGYIKSIGNKAVNMIYAAAGAGAITIADSPHLDVGVNNFAIIWKGTVPDWTNASLNTVLFRKWQDNTNQYSFYIIAPTGKLNFYGAKTGGTTINKQSTNAPTLVDGVEYEFACVVTRETATTAGSVSFYINKVLFETIAIAPGTPANLDNTGSVEILGASTVRYAGVCSHAYLYNRAPDATEIGDIYDNGIAAADQYGSQTAKNVATAENGAGGGTREFDVFDGASATGFHGTDTGTMGFGYFPVTIIAGRKYRVIANTVITAGSVPYYKTSSGKNYTTDLIDTIASNPVSGTAYEFIATQNASYIGVAGYYVSGGFELTVSNFSIVDLGACLALEESGIGDTGWEDSSTNNLDAAYPASGSAVVRFNNIVSTPGGTTYNWESKETGFNHTDSSGYTIEIDDVPGNGHVYMCTTPGTSGSTLPVFSLTAGSTTSDGGTVVWTECTPFGITWPGTPLTFSCAPKYGDYRRRKKYAQPISYSDGGDPYVYDKGLAARDIREITFQRFLTADLTKLLEFIEIVRGAKFRFKFYDELGVAHEVLILNADDITSAPVAQGFEGEISLKLLFL